jgi:hypothetical protein
MVELCRVWISSENAKAVAAKGYRVVHAASDYFYLVSPILALTPFMHSHHYWHRTAEQEVGSAIFPPGIVGVIPSKHGNM